MCINRHKTNIKYHIGSEFSCLITLTKRIWQFIISYQFYYHSMVKGYSHAHCAIFFSVTRCRTTRENAGNDKYRVYTCMKYVWWKYASPKYFISYTLQGASTVHRLLSSHTSHPLPYLNQDYFTIIRITLRNVKVNLKMIQVLELYTTV